MQCLTCHYDLAHLTEHRCPGCGRAFDPNDATSCYVRHSRARFWITIAFIVASLSWALLFTYFYFDADEDLWPARPWNRPNLPTSDLIERFLKVAVFAWVLAFLPTFLLTLVPGAILAILRKLKDTNTSV